MTQPVKINFKLYQGSTFKEVLRWGSDTRVYKPITAISQNAPCVVESTAHGLPVGWGFQISNVKGMKEINSDSDSYIATGTTTDTVTINAVNSVDYTAYTSGGVISYNQPVDLTGFTARMQLRNKVEDELPIVELTTENSGIVIDNVLKTIKIIISAAATAAFTFQTAVYSLELVSSGGEVTPFVNGTITLYKEVTR